MEGAALLNNHQFADLGTGFGFDDPVVQAALDLHHVARDHVPLGMQGVRRAGRFVVLERVDPVAVDGLDRYTALVRQIGEMDAVYPR